MFSGKNIEYIVEDHGNSYKLIARVNISVEKIVDRSYVIGYDEAFHRKEAEEELDTELFNFIYGDLCPLVRRLRWWVSKNCANNLLLLDAYALFNKILELLRMQV
jgi:hypothetical protein